MVSQEVTSQGMRAWGHESEGMDEATNALYFLWKVALDYCMIKSLVFLLPTTQYHARMKDRAFISQLKAVIVSLTGLQQKRVYTSSVMERSIYV